MDKDDIFEDCLRVIDYARGTLNLTNVLDDNWIKVHRGRAFSLLNQLNNLKNKIKKLKDNHE